MVSVTGKDGEDKMALFEVTKRDHDIYQQQIRDYLPNKIIDIHTHVYTKNTSELLGDQSRTVSWPSKVADQNPVEDIIETYRLLLPGKEVTPLIFMNAEKANQEYRDKGNQYCQKVSKEVGFPALYFSHPSEDPEKLEKMVKSGGFLGLKSYLSLSPDYLPVNEIRIFDFFPKTQLKVADKNKWIVMLHIPRDGRLKDEVNLAQIQEIANEFPHLKLIIAHVGRAYCPEDIGNGLEVLSKLPNVYVDFCANCNEYVFEKLIEAVGAERILFGTDLPILRMRTKRICENGKYINLVPPGLYGDESVDPHLREVSAEEAKGITFFLYEEILAFLEAARKTGLGEKDLEKVFYSNAKKLLDHFYI